MSHAGSLYKLLLGHWGYKLSRMDGQKLKRLEEKGYGKWSSWAIWDKKDITDTTIINRSVKELKTTCIVIGLNQSECKPNDANWFNFHVKKRGCRDLWLCKAFNDNPHVRGAYIKESRSVYSSQSFLFFLNTRNVRSNHSIKSNICPPLFRKNS